MTSCLLRLIVIMFGVGHAFSSAEAQAKPYLVSSHYIIHAWLFFLNYRQQEAPTGLLAKYLLDIGRDALLETASNTRFVLSPILSLQAMLILSSRAIQSTITRTHSQRRGRTCCAAARGGLAGVGEQVVGLAEWLALNDEVARDLVALQRALARNVVSSMRMRCRISASTPSARASAHVEPEP